jgi:VIT1/CCC1 family predicted Fe2+/Mn2+ transporter
MDHDALGAHARDELGLSDLHAARPLQAALASASAFAVGAALPVATAAFSPTELRVPLVAAGALVLLALLGGLGARAGGAPMLVAAGRVTFWGALAMAATAAVGRIFHIAA